MKMSTQVDLFTTVEPTSVSPAIAKPFVSRSTFYQGDCLVEMSKIEDKSVDMILCDLPYGTTNLKWDCIIPFDKLWEAYERIIKDNGAIVLTASQPFTSMLVMSNKKMFKYELIWEKTMPTGVAQSSYMPMKYHENILVFYKSKPTFNKIMAERSESGKVRAKTPIYGNSDKSNHVNMGKQDAKQYDVNFVNPKSVLKFNSVANSFGKLHPTQKPIELFEWLVTTYTNEFETVLDNTMGSGTTGVACKKTGRHFIGIEKDEKYFEIAVSRVSAYCG
jgi:site-specific DNA-methyltransferase (adenine-specific)